MNDIKLIEGFTPAAYLTTAAGNTITKPNVFYNWNVCVECGYETISPLCQSCGMWNVHREFAVTRSC